MSRLLDRVVVPLASPDDAEATCDAISAFDVGTVLAVHVVEKAGGAPDKASVEQREAYADEIFAVVADRLGDTVPVETEVAYGTDVAEAVFDVADEFDATAIVVSPRSGSRWLKLLTGDVALSLMTESDRPVVVLPDDELEGDEPEDEKSEDDDVVALDDEDSEERVDGDSDGGADDEDSEERADDEDSEERADDEDSEERADDEDSEERVDGEDGEERVDDEGGGGG